MRTYFPILLRRSNTHHRHMVMNASVRTGRARPTVQLCIVGHARPVRIFICNMSEQSEIAGVMAYSTKD